MNVGIHAKAPRRIAAISLAFLLFFAKVAICQQSSVLIRVINGKTGKPIANERLVFFGGKSPEEAAHKVQKLNDATAGADGVVAYRIDPNATGWIQVFTDGLTPCFANPNSRSFSVDKIIKTGESTLNDCGKAVAQNSPGTFVVFAREANLSEKLAR